MGIIYVTNITGRVVGRVAGLTDCTSMNSNCWRLEICAKYPNESVKTIRSNPEVINIYLIGSSSRLSTNQHNHFFDQFCAKLPGGIMSSRYCLCRCSVACLWISNIWLVAAELLFALPLLPPPPPPELEEDLPPPAAVVCCIAAIAIAW